jgi:hypothetical protein
MRRILAACVIVLWWAAPAWAQDVPLKIDGGNVKTVKVEQTVIQYVDRTLVTTFPFRVQAPEGGVIYSWDFPVGVTARRRGNVLEVTAAPKGELIISVDYAVVDFEKKKTTNHHGEVTLYVGEVVPPGPKPPDPKPPDPPKPPGPATGLRVLIVEESAERAKLPAAQQSIIFSKSVRDWLDANCRPLDAKTKEWGIHDKDTDLTGYSKELEALRTRSRASVPWIIISSDQGVLYEGPLPADVPSTLNLLGKYSPAKFRKAG